MYKLFKACTDKFQTGSSIGELSVEFETIINSYNENRSHLDLVLLFAEHNRSLRTLSNLNNNIELLNLNFSKLDNETKKLSVGLEDVAKAATIPKYAEVYESAKQEYDKFADNWLRVGIILGVFLVI